MRWIALGTWGALSMGLVPAAAAEERDVQGLAGVLLGNTPLVDDLRELTDEIGGRPTGSDVNRNAVDWAEAKLHEAGVKAWRETFEMPELWLGESADARVSGDLSFRPRVVAMPFSVSTPPGGTTAPLVHAGFGGPEDFERLGAAAKGAFVLVETHELLDIEGLFREYAEAVGIEKRALDAGAAGVVYMSSRPKTLLYRHNASLGPDNRHPLVVMERQDAGRLVRLLESGKDLRLTLEIANREGGVYPSENVFGEIPGSDAPEEVVLIGSHLDSWDLGTGANDNGCNVALMIDVARQMKALGVQPRRTIRFALWNGEEQGLVGSWRYTQAHEEEMDRHVMALSVDIGSGRITGFFTNGREELLPAVSQALEPVAGLGPFENINAPIVGTDNFDFMIQGVANLVANQESYNYGPHYHAESDTFDKVDVRQLRMNAAIVAALALGFADMDVTWTRQTRSEIEGLIDSTDLGAQMRSMGVWKEWENGTRGRRP